MPLLLSNEQYDEIMKDYQELRLLARRRQQDNIREAYFKIPQLKEIDAKISSTAICAIKKRRSDPEYNLERAIGVLADEKAVLLKREGYPEDFLEEHFSCPDCSDTGYIGARRCHCFKQKTIDLIYSDKMWQDVFSRENFDSFDITLYDDSKDNTNPKTGLTPRQTAIQALEKAKAFTRTVAEGNCKRSDNLIISGKVGIGKTFLCNCIAGELIDSECFVVYLEAASLFELYERVSFTNKSKEKDFSPGIKDFHFGSIFECDLLIIDDLGTEYANSFTGAKLLDLLNKRLLENMPTLISTNLDINELGNLYPERMISRILGNYKFIHMDGDDIRINKRFM